MPTPLKTPTAHTPTSPAPVLLNEKQAAARLSLSVRTMQLWRRTGEGPVFLKLGAAVRYRIEDLDRFIESAARNGTSAA